MRDAPGQFANRLHLLRHSKLFAGLGQLLLRVVSLGRVSDDISETDQFVIIVSDRDERTGYEKRRTVLPNTPFLNFMLTLLNRQFERAVWFPATALIRTVQYSEMLTNDFVRLVADDLLRGDVPAGHASGRVEQENGIIGNALNENVKVPLDVLKRQCCLIKLKLQ